MQEIFYPFRYRDLPVIKDGICDGAEIVMAVSAGISADTAVITAIPDEVCWSAVSAAVYPDWIDQSDLFIWRNTVFGVIPLMYSGWYEFLRQRDIFIFIKGKIAQRMPSFTGTVWFVWHIGGSLDYSGTNQPNRQVLVLIHSWKVTKNSFLFKSIIRPGKSDFQKSPAWCKWGLIIIQGFIEALYNRIVWQIKSYALK